MNAWSSLAGVRLHLAGGVSVAAFGAIGLGGLPLGSRAFFAALACTVGAYVVALRVASAGAPATRRGVLIALGIALTMRVPIAAAPAGAQSDIFRYLWDARLQRASLNPYDVVPEDPAVIDLHTASTRKMNNSSVPSPYPPAAQVFFRIATAGGESVYAVRWAVIVCDALIALLLWRWLVQQGRNPLLVVAYAWNPLVVMESAIGHYDAAGALLVLATAVAISRGYRAAAAAAFAVSIAMKFLPIVLAPLLWRRIRVRDAAIGTTLLVALYGPYVSGWRIPLGSIAEVVERFRFNAPVFELLESGLGARTAAAVAVFAGLAVAALFAIRGRVTDPGAWAWPMAAALVCSPIVYPWYLVWLAPFLVTRGTVPLLAWTGSILPVYVVWERARVGERWSVPPELLVIEFGLVGIAAAALLWMRRSSGRTAPDPASPDGMPESMRVTLIVPTHNERDAIAHVLRDIPSALVSEVIVVDSNSDDGTPEIAAALGARVVPEPRRGYGRACLTGIEAASTPDVVVFLDGDYSDRPAELPDLLAPIRAGRADIVIGSRLAGRLRAGAMPRHAVWGNRFAAWLIRWLYGLTITDLGPFRAVRADVLRALDLRETTYGWAVELIVRGARHGYRVVEVPVSYHPRIGRSKISGTLRGSVGAGYGILSGILKHRLRRD